MLRVIAILLLVSSSAAAARQAAFHVGVRVVSSARVTAMPAAQRDRIQLEVAGRGTQAPLVLLGAAAGWVPASGEVKFKASSSGEVVVTFLY